ncbi:hypothetical protein [Serratia fonticola]|uniref:Uncharacterized protein n=1 Tax=Serratia fonticola TaxID=47917 RepID=A0AAW3WQN1_SERFO|nr:hypothetical protein [Serratia fonticola]MBC3211907.1 hypothetical protein [Serratia fonticola]NYA13468.1 hypothetical protein [Serratia fonticola]NYA33278.1 hypothetical protein [Serratia fonticola]
MQLLALGEEIILERIEFIARLGRGEESQPKDKDIALIWISELAEEMKGNIASEKAEINRKIANL